MRACEKNRRAWEDRRPDVCIFTTVCARCSVVPRVRAVLRLVRDRAVLAALEAVHLVARLGRGERLDGRPRALRLEAERAERDAHVAHLAPVLAPAVAHDPVARA